MSARVVRVLVLLPVVLLALLLVARCALPPFGEHGYQVEYRNLTGRDLTLYLFGERDGRPDVAPFRQGDVSSSLWRYPRDENDTRRVVVFATDAFNTLLYCAYFGFREIRALNYRIDVVAGTNTCR